MKIFVLTLCVSVAVYANDSDYGGIPPLEVSSLDTAHPGETEQHYEFPYRITTPSTDPMPRCNARRAAYKALRGDFGALPQWKIDGYTRILKRGAVRKTAWVTNYAIGEPGVNDTTTSGEKVRLGRTAAMLHDSGRRLRRGEFGFFVLINMPGGMELRQVFDTGSPANRGRAIRRGANTWVDRYVTSGTNRSWITDIYVERN